MQPQEFQSGEEMDEKYDLILLEKGDCRALFYLVQMIKVRYAKLKRMNRYSSRISSSVRISIFKEREMGL